MFILTNGGDVMKTWLMTGVSHGLGQALAQLQRTREKESAAIEEMDREEDVTRSTDFLAQA